MDPTEIEPSDEADADAALLVADAEDDAELDIVLGVLRVGGGGKGKDEYCVVVESLGGALGHCRLLAAVSGDAAHSFRAAAWRGLG